MVHGDERFGRVHGGDDDFGLVVGEGAAMLDPASDPTVPGGSGASPHAGTMSGARAQAYARGLAPIYVGTIALVLDTVAQRVPLPEATLLDVGSGVGSLTAGACERGARVVAVDPAVDMRRATHDAAPDAKVLDGTAPTLPLPDGEADIVVANFLLEHVEDPRATLADLVRVARPGGVVAVTMWAPDSALPRLWAQVAMESGAEPVRGRRVADHADFARSGTGLASLLDGAGLDGVEVHTMAWLATIDADDLWAAPAAGIGDLGYLLSGQDEETLDRARRAFDRLTADHGELVCEAILGVGVKA